MLQIKLFIKGLSPNPEKVDAIQKAPATKDKTKLQSYLGMLNFYRKFLPDAATLLEPLTKLLKNNVVWT